MIAHIGGVPVEEALLPSLSGASAALLLARALLVSRLRRGRRWSPGPFRAAERWISGLRWISVQKRQFRRRTTGKAEAR